MLKIGLVGCGGISGVHVPAWDKMDDAQLVAVCDIRPEKAERYPGHKIYTDFDKMLEENDFDIIDICLPTFLHCEFAVKAMKKGINVLSEKPISLKESDVGLLFSTAKENGVKYMVAQVLRFWNEYEALKQIYDTKKIRRAYLRHDVEARRCSARQLERLVFKERTQRTYSV